MECVENETEQSLKGPNFLVFFCVDFLLLRTRYVLEIQLYSRSAGKRHLTNSHKQW